MNRCEASKKLSNATVFKFFNEKFNKKNEQFMWMTKIVCTDS